MSFLNQDYPDNECTKAVNEFAGGSYLNPIADLTSKESSMAWELIIRMIEDKTLNDYKLMKVIQAIFENTKLSFYGKNTHLTAFDFNKVNYHRFALLGSLFIIKGLHFINNKTTHKNKFVKFHPFYVDEYINESLEPYVKKYNGPISKCECMPKWKYVRFLENLVKEHFTMYFSEDICDIYNWGLQDNEEKSEEVEEKTTDNEEKSEKVEEKTTDNEEKSEVEDKKYSVNTRKLKYEGPYNGTCNTKVTPDKDSEKKSTKVTPDKDSEKKSTKVTPDKDSEKKSTKVTPDNNIEYLSHFEMAMWNKVSKKPKNERVVDLINEIKKMKQDSGNISPKNEPVKLTVMSKKWADVV